MKVEILANAIEAKVHHGSQKALKLTSEVLSYSVPTKNGEMWLTMLDWGTFRFPAGFVKIVAKELRAAGFAVRVKQQSAPQPLGPPIRSMLVDNHPADPKRDYMYVTAERLLKHKGMVAKLATAAGKSAISRLCYRAIDRPTLFITTRKALMSQMKEGLEDLTGERVGIIGDSKFEPAKFTVATVKSIAPYLKEYDIEGQVQLQLLKDWAKLEKKIQEHKKSLKIKGPALKKELDSYREQLKSKLTDVSMIRVKKKAAAKKHNDRHNAIKQFLDRVEFLIGEEAQEVSADGYYNVCMACKNAHYRLALTATPGLSEKDLANMRLWAAFGPIGMEVTEEELIGEEILAKPHFKFLDLPAPQGLKKHTSYRNAHKIGIIENKIRNAAIVERAKKAKELGLPCLILVLRTAHGKILKDMLTKAGLDCDYIRGRDKQEVRSAGIAKLEEGGLLIGTNIMDVGIDMPKLTVLIKAAGGKAKGTDIQRIGRTLRGGDISLVIDFEDKGNDTLRSHALKRKQVVLTTPGFKEGLLPDDFEEFSLWAT